MRVGIVNESEETLDQAVWTVVLAQGEKVVGAATLLRRRGAGSADTNGVVLVWSRRYDLLEADLVAPGDVEVVLIPEALAGPKVEISQAHLVGIVGKANPAKIGDAVGLA